VSLLTAPSDELVDFFSGYDFSKLIPQKKTPLDDFTRRAEARLARWTPYTVEDRFAAFKITGFHPHGIYLPDDKEQASRVNDALGRIGAVEDPERRLRLYYKLQDRTESWQTAGVPGHWTGQQGVCRSGARFRIDARGRRGGKTELAAQEALGVAITRPRASVWVAAPTMKLVGRAFDKMIEMVRDLGLETEICRNTLQEKLIVLKGNGSRIEGVSLDNIFSAAGASVDYAIVDEAAQLPPEAWYRAILPPLADRNGQALLISSWEGEGNFFYDLVMDAQRRMEEARELALATGKDVIPLWEMFTGPTWDNFFAFPQGRNTATIKEAEATTPPIDFLEQYGAVPAKNREKVYTEFKERVHLGSFPYQPGRPVILVVDPSNGINPYGALAIQDFGDDWNVVDEFYDTGVITEQVSAIMRAKPYSGDVESVLMDSAREDEVVRWVNLGWPAVPVDKPQVEDRIPYVRNQLRDPRRFFLFYMSRVRAGWDLSVEQYYALPLAEQRNIAIQVEEALADPLLTVEDIEILRGCSHMHVNRDTCPNLVFEFNRYKYPKLTGDRSKNYQEKPQKAHDHLMDCAGYYCWTYKRFEDSNDVLMQSYVRPARPTEVGAATRQRVPGEGWLYQVRAQVAERAARSATQSYLRAV
jgi:hypothetical protein